MKFDISSVLSHRRNRFLCIKTDRHSAKSVRRTVPLFSLAVSLSLVLITMGQAITQPPGPPPYRDDPDYASSRKPTEKTWQRQCTLSIVWIHNPPRAFLETV
jgi:hypothetical protein